MPHPSRTVILLPSAARSSSSAGDELVIAEQYTAMLAVVDVTAISGAGATLTVYIQNGLRSAGTGASVGDDADGAKIWDDFVAFDAMTATSRQWLRLVGGGSLLSAASDAALAADTVRNGPLGGPMRIKYNISGSTPSITFSVVGLMIP